MEPGSQAQPQRIPFNQQRRNQAQWQVVGQPNRGQVSGRHRQGQGPPNQSEKQSQPPNPTPSQHEHQSQNQHVNQPHNQLPHQSQGPDRPNHNRSFRKRDTRERSHRFGAPVSQPGSSQSSDSEVVDRPGMRQHGLREAEREHLGTNAGRVPAHIEASKPEPAPKVEPSLSDEQQLQEFTKQRDELNRNIEQLRAKLADRAEVAALRKQLEQLQAQFAEEQKLRKNLEGAYQESQKVQQKMQADAREVETQANQLRGQLRERDAHIQQLGDELNRKDQQLRDNQEQSDEANWRNNSALRDQENQIRVLTKEKEEALAEANARHVIIERHTNSIAGLERQLQEHVQKLEEKDEQLQAAQDSAWAKDEQLRDSEAAWKAQMDQMSLFHQRQGQHLQEAAHRAWHEKTVAQRQLEDFQQYHEKVVRQMQEQLASATRAPAGAAKPEPPHKGLPNGVPPPGASVPSAGTRGPAEATPAPPILPPGVPPSILPPAHPLPAPPLAQGSRAVQPMHPASKPQSSQPVHPPNLQTDPPPPGQHQQGLQRRAVEPQPAPVSANPPAHPPPPQNPVQFPPRQPEPYRPPTESAKPPAQDNSPVSAPAQTPQNVRPGNEPRAKMLDEEGLLACFAELIPGRAEDAIAINTVLANKLTPRIAPHVWRTYRKEHGTLREFLAAHPESFRVTSDDKVYLTPEAQQKRGTPPSSGTPAQPTASNSPTPQEASRAAAQNAPGGSVSESTAKGGSPPQVAVTPIAANAAAQKQRQRQQQNGPRTDSGGSNGRPADPPPAANGKPAGKANVSNRGNGHVAGNRPQGSGRVPAASNGGNISGGQNAGSAPRGNAKSGPRTDVQNPPRQGPLHVVNGNGPSVNGPSANGGSVNGGNAYGHQSTANGGPGRVGGSTRQIGSKSPSSAQPSKPLYVPKGSTVPAKESETAKA